MGQFDGLVNELVGDLSVESLVWYVLGFLAKAGGILSSAMGILGLILWTSRLNKRAGRNLVMWAIVFGVLNVILNTY